MKLAVALIAVAVAVITFVKLAVAVTVITFVKLAVVVTSGSSNNFCEAGSSSHKQKR